jgi:hypothetical protein
VVLEHEDDNVVEGAALAGDVVLVIDCHFGPVRPQVWRGGDRGSRQGTSGEAKHGGGVEVLARVDRFDMVCRPALLL